LSQIYSYCNTNKVGLTEAQLGNALALLGQKVSADVIKDVFNKSKVDPMPEEIFIAVVCQLRKRKLADGQAEMIQNAFDALYDGFSKSGSSNKDESGRNFLDPKDLRRLLTTQGEKLSDEEADQFIRECHPIYIDSEDGIRRGMIFLDQYRDALINAAT